MRKTKKFINIIMLLFVVCVSLVACKQEEKITIKEFEVAEELDAAIGDYFDVPQVIAKDSKDNLHYPKVKVLDNEDNNITIDDNKVFIAKLSDYRIIYDVVVDEKVLASKTTVIKVYDNSNPEITLHSYVDLVIKGQEYTIPKAETDDNSNLNVSVSVKVMFNETEVLVVDNKFVATNEGKYQVVYTAQDVSGNSSSKTLEVTSVYEENNLTYFNYQGSSSFVSANEIVTVSESNDRVYPDNSSASVLKLSAVHTADALWADVVLEKPIVKDISNFNYVYFWVYNNNISTSKISFNQIYNVIELKPLQWTKVVLVNDNGVYKTLNGHKVFVGDLTQEDISMAGWDQATYEKYQLINPSSKTDITKLKMVIEGAADTTCEYYLSALYSADEMPNYSLVYNNAVPLNESFILPTVGNGVSQKVYQMTNNGYELYTDGSFTSAVEGVYNFYYELYSDEVLVDTKEISVTFYEKENNKLAYLDKEWALSNMSVNIGQLSYSTTKTHDLFNACVLYTSSNDFSDLTIKNIVINDLSSYNSLFFYIYNDSNDMLVHFLNNDIEWNPYTLKGGEWTLIELRKNADGDFVAVGFDGNVRVAINEANTTNLGNIRLVFQYEDFNTSVKNVYISPVFVRSLPEVILDLPEKVETNQTVNLPQLENSIVKVTDVELNEVTVENNAVVFAEPGEYTVTYTIKHTFGPDEVKTHKIIVEEPVVEEVVEGVKIVDFNDVNNIPEGLNQFDGYFAGDKAMNFNNLGTENEWFDKTITLAEPLVLARVTKMYFYFKVNNQTHDAGLAVGSMQKYTVKAGANDQWVKVVIEKEELASYFGDVTQLESIRFIRQVGAWSWESITISSIYAVLEEPVVEEVVQVEKIINFNNSNNLPTGTSQQDSYIPGDKALFFNNNGSENEWFDKTINLAKPLDLSTVSQIYFYFKVNNKTHDGGLAVGSMQKYTVNAAGNNEWVKVVIDAKDLASYFGEEKILSNIRFIRQVGAWSWESIVISSVYVVYNSPTIVDFSVNVPEGMNQQDDLYGKVANFNPLESGVEWFDKTITLAKPLDLTTTQYIYFYFKVNNQTHNGGLAVGSMQKYTVNAAGNNEWVKVVIGKEEFTNYFGDVTQLESIRFIRQVGAWEGVTISNIYAQQDGVKIVDFNDVNNVPAGLNQFDSVCSTEKAINFNNNGTENEWFDKTINLAKPLDLTTTNKIYFYFKVNNQTHSGGLAVGANQKYTANAAGNNEWVKVVIEKEDFVNYFGDVTQLESIRFIRQVGAWSWESITISSIYAE